MAQVKEKIIVNVIWKGKSELETNIRGAKLTIRTVEEEERGPTAPELLLAAVGSSLATEMLKEARKMRIPINNVEIKVKGVKSSKKIPRFTDINVQVSTTTAQDEDAKKLQELVRRLERNSIVCNTLKEQTKIRIKTTFET
ncbi:MAG: OsmC family protein [Candidatus Baldrarchaeia archaeon]|nr:OsmC family protein [Candidatus Baldrarchaeota archaeon]